VIALRTATRDDIGAVLAFWSEATAEPSATDDADGLLALFDRAPDALVVAVDGDVAAHHGVVGTVIGGWDGWRGSLYRLAVAPAHRRRGIATALVHEAERRLFACGVRRMHLIVGRGGGAAAEQFWRAARYEPTDQMRMVKDLG
jgi:ribosomal protein S18 acetylase RimI-like enzyme